MHKITLNDVSIITMSKGRLHHLTKTIDSFLTQNTHEVIVVDYGCPDNTYEWCVSQNNPRLKSIRASSIKEYFNISKARNIGARLAIGNVLLFADVDNLMPLHFTQNCIDFMANEDVDLCCPAYFDFCMSGTCLVKASVWNIVRGYDESLSGWGYDDIDFYDRVKFAGFTRGLFMNHGLTSISHSDEESTKYYENKNKDETAHINIVKILDKSRPINQCEFGIPNFTLI